MGLSDLFDSAKNIFDTAKAKAVQLKSEWDQQKALDIKLRSACFRGDIVEVRRLLQEGAKDYNNALTDAVRSGNKEIVKILISRGAEVWHLEPFLIALEKGGDELAGLLVTKMRSDALKESRGGTALMHAARKGLTQLCGALVSEYGTDVNATDGSRDALGWAIRGGHKDTAELLLRAGARVGHRHLDAAKEYCPDLRDSLSIAFERQAAG